MILPTICVMADPIVFAGTFGGDGPLLGGIKPFAYVLSFTSIMAMTAYLLWGNKLRGAGAALSGLFLVGSLVSLAVGIVIFPISLGAFVFDRDFRFYAAIFSLYLLPELYQSIPVGKIIPGQAGFVARLSASPHFSASLFRSSSTSR